VVTAVTGRVALGRPSAGAVLLSLTGAAQPGPGATLPVQGTRLCSLRAETDRAPEPAPAAVIGAVPGRLRGMATSVAMTEPANLAAPSALIDAAGAIQAVVVDTDAAGRPLALSAHSALSAPREPVGACGG
jgi:hypothetical protein